MLIDEQTKEVHKALVDKTVNQIAMLLVQKADTETIILQKQKTLDEISSKVAELKGVLVGLGAFAQTLESVLTKNTSVETSPNVVGFPMPGNPVHTIKNPLEVVPEQLTLNL